MGPSTWPPTKLHLRLIRCSSLLLDQRGIAGEKKTALGKMGKWGQGLGSSGSSGCPVCLRSVFPMEAVMAADRTPYHKVLPVAGKYDKKETLKLEAESEHRRREEAVLATKRVMAERARVDAEARQREGIQTYVKIAETVAI